MLSLYKPLQAAQAETYFKEHYSQDDYYSEGQTCMGRWLGKGAAALGLAGEVKREDFTALLQGRNPHDGDVLVDVATHNGKHNAGWDAGLSAPKTVSIQALLEDKRLMEAHNEAVEATVPQLERFALANKRPIITANIVAAAFNHQAARPTPGALPDPQLHTHVVLMNMTQRPDSKWRALREREIFKAREFLTAVYRTELAKRVQKLGYRIEVTGSDGTWEIAGYSRDQVEAFSHRRQQIKQKMDETGLSGAAAQQIFALQTRQAKGSYDEGELTAWWKAHALECVIDTATHVANALRRGNVYNGQAPNALLPSNLRASMLVSGWRFSTVAFWKLRRCNLGWAGWTSPASGARSKSRNSKASSFAL
jgi:conjugative relaxase-like TrwC/TraI family protein